MVNAHIVFTGRTMSNGCLVRLSPRYQSHANQEKAALSTFQARIATSVMIALRPMVMTINMLFMQGKFIKSLSISEMIELILSKVKFLESIKTESIEIKTNKSKAAPRDL